MAGDKCRNSFSDFPLYLPLFPLGNAILGWESQGGGLWENTQYGVQSASSTSRTEHELESSVQDEPMSCPGSSTPCNQPVVILSSSLYSLDPCSSRRIRVPLFLAPLPLTPHAAGPRVEKSGRNGTVQGSWQRSGWQKSPILSMMSGRQSILHHIVWRERARGRGRGWPVASRGLARSEQALLVMEKQRTGDEDPTLVWKRKKKTFVDRRSRPSCGAYPWSSDAGTSIPVGSAKRIAQYTSEINHNQQG